MGRDKALLPWPPKNEVGGTFVSEAIRSLNAHVDLVIVVAGANLEQLAPVVYAEGAFLVENTTPEQGQFSSLRVGLQDVLSRGRDAAIITLVDRPPVRPATLEILLAAFVEALERKKWAVVPEFEGRHGHPILASREMLEAFLRAPATATAREVERTSQAFLEYVPVDDEFVIQNVDTPSEYGALVE